MRHFLSLSLWLSLPFFLFVSPARAAVVALGAMYNAADVYASDANPAETNNIIYGGAAWRTTNAYLAYLGYGTHNFRPISPDSQFFYAFSLEGQGLYLERDDKRDHLSAAYRHNHDVRRMRTLALWGLGVGVSLGYQLYTGLPSVILLRTKYSPPPFNGGSIDHYLQAGLSLEVAFTPSLIAFVAGEEDFAYSKDPYLYRGMYRRTFHPMQRFVLGMRFLL